MRRETLTAIPDRISLTYCTWSCFVVIMWLITAKWKPHRPADEQLPVWSIPKFRDSCNVMELLFSRKMADKGKVHCFEALRHISNTFHEAYTICTRVLRIRSHIGSASWNFQHIFWLISPFKRRDAGEILVSFQGRWTSIYYFLDSHIFDEVLYIFPRLSYRLTSTISMWGW